MYEVVDLAFTVTYISNIKYTRRKLSDVRRHRAGTQNYRRCKADENAVTTCAPAPVVHIVRRRAKRAQPRRKRKIISARNVASSKEITGCRTGRNTA